MQRNAFVMQYFSINKSLFNPFSLFFLDCYLYYGYEKSNSWKNVSGWKRNFSFGTSLGFLLYSSLENVFTQWCNTILNVMYVCKQNATTIWSAMCFFLHLTKKSTTLLLVLGFYKAKKIRKVSKSIFMLFFSYSLNSIEKKFFLKGFSAYYDNLELYYIYIFY